MIKVSVSGLDEVKRKLEKLASDEQEKIIQSAFEKGAGTIQQSAIQFCPVATGELKNAIIIKTTNRKGNVVCKVGIQGGGHKYRGQFFYGSFVEFGHYAGKRNSYELKKKQTKGMGRKWIDGKHFLRQAAQAHKTDVPGQIVADIQAGIERLAT